MLRLLMLAILILACQVGIGVAAAVIVSEDRAVFAFFMCYVFGMYMGSQYVKIHPDKDESLVLFRLNEGRTAFLVDRLIKLPLQMVFFGFIMIPWAMKVRSSK
jgi:hypothetical protein